MQMVAVSGSAQPQLAGIVLLRAVKAEGLVVTYTQDDKGSTKEIHNLYAEKFIRPA